MHWKPVQLVKQSCNVLQMLGTNQYLGSYILQINKGASLERSYKEAYAQTRRSIYMSALQESTKSCLGAETDSKSLSYAN